MCPRLPRPTLNGFVAPRLKRRRWATPRIFSSASMWPFMGHDYSDEICYFRPARAQCARRVVRFCILADDLTGANASAVLLKHEGLSSLTHLFAHAPHGGAPSSLQEDGAHVLDLGTRELTGREAVARLAVAVGWLGDAPDLIGL